MNEVGEMSNAAQEFGGRWTKEKLGILRRYLDAYTKALKHQKFKTGLH